MAEEIHAWSPTALLIFQYRACVWQTDGMPNFHDLVAVCAGQSVHYKQDQEVFSGASLDGPEGDLQACWDVVFRPW